jgi:pSer/pThr/pTyr-binding forkhead associated (FHA) protein
MSGLIVLTLRLLMAAAVYTFLGWALWIIWQDLKQEGQKALVRRFPAIRLEVRNRNRVLSSQTFSKPEIILGRNPECDITMDDATASARHAKLSYHHNQWWIEDLNSTNGTKLNKEKLALPTVITSDDEIQCGKTKVIVNLSGDAVSPRTQKL